MNAHQQYRKEAAERRKLVLRLSRKGVAQAEIAKLAGVSRQRVNQIVKAAGEAK